MSRDDRNNKIEPMLFNYETSYKHDFRCDTLSAPVFTKYKEKDSCLRRRPPPLKDIHTLCNWKTDGIPFNLLHRPRPIIGTDPTKVQEPYFEPLDLGKEEAIKTRPRLVMTPALSVDAIEDPEARQILLDDIYTSDMTRGMREGIRSYFRVAAPLPGLPAEANPIKLPKLNPPVVSPEWRMNSVSWDQRQLRSYCDSTRDFWLRKKLSPCNVCDNYNAVHAQRKMACLAESGRITQGR